MSTLSNSYGGFGEIDQKKFEFLEMSCVEKMC